MSKSGAGKPELLQVQLTVITDPGEIRQSGEIVLAVHCPVVDRAVRLGDCGGCPYVEDLVERDLESWLRCRHPEAAS